jgi:hypothetical protein
VIGLASNLQQKFGRCSAIVANAAMTRRARSTKRIIQLLSCYLYINDEVIIYKDYMI